MLNGFIIILSTIFVFACAFYFFYKNKYANSLFFNILGGFILRGWCASDKFLHIWDERYHALVAKNLMRHPFRPTLYDNPIFPYDFKAWGDSHIWLCKQPLPLWAMAGSMKIFGVNEIALRLPSLIIGSLAIVLTFFIVRQLFNTKVAFWASFFHAIHGLTIEANAGRDAGDHIATFFTFFVELGVLMAVFSNKKEQKHLFSILTGVCMGLAFLCKWQPSLLILPIWMVAQSDIRTVFRNILPLIIAAFLVAAPWQYYIFQNFPTETKWIYSAMIEPISQAIQGHSGAWWFYIEQVRITFGEIIYIPILWLTIVFFQKIKNEHIRILTVWLFFPFIIYSMMATKRQSYLLDFAPAFFILTALFVQFLYDIKEKKSISPFILQMFIVLLFALPIRYTFERVKPFEKKTDEIGKTRVLKKWQKQWVNAEKTVVFNTISPIEAMFYNPIAAAYIFIPTTEQVNELTAKGYKIAIVRTQNIPIELLNRKDILFL